jgi:hypothetical protein
MRCKLYRLHAGTFGKAGCKPELAAHAGHTTRTCLASHMVRQFAGDSHAQTAAAVFAGYGVVGLFKRHKEPTQSLRCNTDAGGHYFKQQQHMVVGLLLQQILEQD